MTWDTCVTGEDHGSIDVSAVLASLDGLDGRPTLIALHHPPVPPTTNPVFRLINGQELVDSLKNHPHVRAVVSGHAHTPFERHQHGLTLLGGPSVCVPFQHGPRGELTIGQGGPTGAQALFLGVDGALETRVIAA